MATVLASDAPPREPIWTARPAGTAALSLFTLIAFALVVLVLFRSTVSVDRCLLPIIHSEFVEELWGAVPPVLNCYPKEDDLNAAVYLDLYATLLPDGHLVATCSAHSPDRFYSRAA
eukprot:CAMPEP_0119151040 /NCGR_PEP_ID=MMETSP1310-20130426/45762_1 /TAXON_ID=464262 /ORGANISM="Genus nov. species nov., Strain RCC2339" /LENGTH=116 /DNA_ID=CAMNT_0007143287 /DNA_START=33 /DNA_END=379 /DNA_ORIENTATION=+